MSNYTCRTVPKTNQVRAQRQPQTSNHVSVPLVPLSSTLSPSLLRESAVATLERRGSTFGDLTLTQFDDPLLAEHALYLAVVDIPRHVSVQLAS